MKKLLLSIFLLAQFACHAPGLVRGQSAPATLTDKAAALQEADSLTARAVQLFQAGNFDEALPLAEQSLKLRESAVGREHQSVAAAHKNLGAIYFAKGKADKSRQHYSRALSLYEKNPAGNTEDIPKLLDALGLIERFGFGYYSGARERYERSLALKQSALGAEHEEVVKTLYDLSELYQLLGHDDKAVEAQRRVIGIREKQQATKPTELIFALNRFACLSQRLDMKAETAEARQRSKQLKDAIDAKRVKKIVDGMEVEEVLNGRAILKPAPFYPAEAKRKRVSGTVLIFITLDENGRVVDTHPCGHPLLSEAALRAAHAARFTPMLLEGKPVKVRGIVTYNFVLQ